MTDSLTMRFIPARPQPALFEPAKVLASEELKAARLAVCATCQFNQNQICRQCCGGVPVATLVNLAASRCARKLWK